MPTLDEYATHSPYTAPGRYAELLDAVPVDLPGLSTVVRNVLVHYRASGYKFPPERLEEIDNRWVERILAVDQGRFPQPLAVPRPDPDRVAGCCRDFTLLAVAALRQHGVPARSRIGFAGYFDPDYWYDHVVVELWDGRRWNFVDAQLDPAGAWSIDPLDLPRRVGTRPERPPVFATAAQVWTAYRRGELDPDRYGVGPGVPLGGPWFIRNYVISELAHRQRDELLLWDGWGDMRLTLGDELRLVDEVATLLLAADDGDTGADAELDRRYAGDSRLRPSGTVRCFSPTGHTRQVDLATREAVPVE